MDSKLFRCLLCNGRFCLKDVGKEFFPSTSICAKCYETGQQSENWCFGKTDIRDNGRTVQFGYNASSFECKQECPDRKICKVFALDWKPKIKRRIIGSMAKKKKHDEEDEDDEEETTDDETEEEEDDAEEDESDEDETSESDDEEDSDESDSDDADSEDEEDEEEDSEEVDEESEEDDEDDSEREERKSKKGRVKDEEEDEDEEEEEEKEKSMSKSKTLKLLQKAESIIFKLIAQYKADEEDEEEKPKRNKRGRKPKKEKKVREKAPRVGPFMASSIRGKAMAMALKGASIKKIEKMVKKEGGDARQIIRLLRSEKTPDGRAKWECDDSKGHIHVSKLKVK